MKVGKHTDRLVWLLVLAWLLPGLMGHDPWKPDEAYSMGLVYHILETGDWVVPTLANEPFLEKPPLYFVTAAWTAAGFSAFLPLHDGARLASGFYMGMLFLFAALTGRALYGKGHGIITMIILMGCIGLLPHTHLMITDTALLAGFGMALYGLALGRQRPWVGGFLLGSGAGIGFLSKGLLAPFTLGGVVLVLLSLSQAWRNRNFVLSLGVAMLVALPWLTLWPYTLYQRSPELFHVWLWENNLGRFFGFSKLTTQQETGYYLKALSWFTWPALPLALVTLWQSRGTDRWQVPMAWRAPELLLPLVMSILLLAVLMLSSAVRELYLLPLLLPLSLLATPAVTEGKMPLPSRLVGRLIITLFGGLALLVWLVWLLAINQPFLASLATHLFPPEFFILQAAGGVPFQGVAVALALVATGIWLFRAREFGISVRHVVVGWTGSITLIWLLLMTLWLPVIDYGKSYRSMIMAMMERMPVCHTCVASRGLGEPQRAMLHYFGQILTHRIENGFQADPCDLLLEGSPLGKVTTPPLNGHTLWEGGRPGDKKEWYVLYQTPLTASSLPSTCTHGPIPKTY